MAAIRVVFISTNELLNHVIFSETVLFTDTDTHTLSHLHTVSAAMYLC